jgi:hypothetical protein
LDGIEVIVALLTPTDILQHIEEQTSLAEVNQAIDIIGDFVGEDEIAQVDTPQNRL